MRRSSRSSATTSRAFIPQLVPARPTLDALADRVADTFVDATPELIEAQRSGGQLLTVEVTVKPRQPRAGACASCCACAT